MNATDGAMKGTIMSLDIETAPDPEAARLLSFARPTTRVHAAVHRIVAAAWLRGAERPDGTWSIDALGSHSDDDGEESVIALIDDQLRETLLRDGEVCTYYGSRHDMPVIRRRAMRHWMFGATGIFPPSPLRHVDLAMSARDGFRDLPKLRELCAGVAIPCDPTISDGRVTHPLVRKAEVDAVATWLLRLHQLTAERGSRETLVSAWSALVEYIRRVRPHDAHLRQFTRSAELVAALQLNRQRRGDGRA